MLRRCLKSWCRGIALLALLGPAVALACSPAPPTSWKKKSPGGRFELSLEARKGSFTGPFPVALRDTRTRKVLWKHSLDNYVSSGDLHVAPSGHYVARAETFSETVILLGPDGNERGRWSLAEQLKPSELRRIPYTSCGRMWLGARRFEGDVLVLEVLTGGAVPPIYEQPKGTLMRIDARSGKLTREEPPPAQSTAELIQAWRSAPDERSRHEPTRELLGRSADVGVGGDAELSRFWQQLLTNPELPSSTHTAAVEGLRLVATDEELRQVARLPKGNPERNLELLQVLERRLPDEAETYAVRALQEQWPPDLLRQRAVVFLSKRQPVVARKGFTLALTDSAGKVREAALSQMADPPVLAVTVEQVLAFCEDPDDSVRWRVVESLRRMLDGVEKKERPAALEVLRRADTAGKLSCFPEGWVILGGVADLQGDRPRALELYSRGLKGLEALEVERRNHSRDLWLEATLQLAFEAKRQGNRSGAVRLARQVLADDRNGMEFVCAPRANKYAGEAGGRGCQTRLAAGNVAERLLEEAAPGR